MSILYPVAETAEAAVHTPRGHAVREREAQALAAGPVAFVTEPVGPAFASREAAMEAYPGAQDEGWRRLVPVSGVKTPGAKIPGAKTPGPKLVRPVYRDGRRWPEPQAGEAVRWRLSVSYWRIGGRAADAPTTEPARKVRKGETGRELGGAALNALARQPLRAFRPQQPLDIGLFEAPLPEAPDSFIPDE